MSPTAEGIIVLVESHNINVSFKLECLVCFKDMFVTVIVIVLIIKAFSILLYNILKVI